MLLKILQLFFHTGLFTVFIICSFFVGIVLSPFYIYRLCVSFLAKIFLPGSIDIVSTLESTLGEDDITSCPKSAICGVIVLNAPATLAEIRKLFKNKLVYLKQPNSKSEKNSLCYPRFQQYPEKWFGYNFWKWDKDFCIENHIRVYQERNNFITEDEIITEIGNLRMLPFRKKTPLWEILFVENYVSKSDISNNNTEIQFGDTTNCGCDSRRPKTALIFKVHHMMADGYSLLTAFMKDLCGKNMEYHNPVPKNDNVNSKVKVAWEMSHYFLRIPYLLLRQYLVDIDFHIWCSWESKLTHEMFSYWTEKIPVTIIKEISKKNNVSFTSVLLAGIAGGINKYFVKANMGQSLPRVMRAIAAAPVSGHPFNGLCNHWTFAVIPLPTGTSTSEGRLQKANASVLDLKSSPTPLVNYYLMFVLGLLPGWMIKIFGKAFFGTAVMSNFPGPAKEMKFGEEFPIEDMAFWPIFYRGRAGLGFTMLSYMDGVRISITVDKAHINTRGGVKELANFIEQEFDVMNVPVQKSSLKAE